MSDDFFNLNGERIERENSDSTEQQNQNLYDNGQNSYNQNPYNQNPYGNGQDPYNNTNQWQNQDSNNQGSNYNNSNYNYGQNPYDNNQNPYANYSQNPNWNMQPKQGPNSLAITAFVLSLVAPILCCCSSFGIILSAVACIASIVLAFMSKQKKPFHGLAIAALIISFLYLAVLIFLIVCVVIVFSNPDMIEMYEQLLNEFYGDIYNDLEYDLFRFIKF